MPLYGALWTLQRHSKCDPIGCHNRPNNLLAMVNQDVCLAPYSVAKLRLRKYGATLIRGRIRLGKNESFSPLFRFNNYVSTTAK